MPSEIMREVLQLIETQAHLRPVSVEFEMAYQVRVAMDRIRFVIKQTDQFAPHSDQMREAGLQLLDALERLESADRSFQKRLRALRPDGSCQSRVWPAERNDRPSSEIVRESCGHL